MQGSMSVSNVSENPLQDVRNIPHERVADENERASCEEALFTAQSLNSIQQRLKPEFHPDFDGETCVDCGDDMPPARLKDGRVRCTACQTNVEKRSRQFRH